MSTRMKQQIGGWALMAAALAMTAVLTGGCPTGGADGLNGWWTWYAGDPNDASAELQVAGALYIIGNQPTRIAVSNESQLILDGEEYDLPADALPTTVTGATYVGEGSLVQVGNAVTIVLTLTITAPDGDGTTTAVQVTTMVGTLSGGQIAGTSTIEATVDGEDTDTITRPFRLEIAG